MTNHSKYEDAQKYWDAYNKANKASSMNTDKLKKSDY